MLTGLWRSPNFVRLWAGHTISRIGSQVTLLALPLAAILILNATPAQMGILRAVQYAPFLLFSLFIGVWVDRVQHRVFLIGSDLGRALLLLIIPILTWLNILRIEYLYIIGFLIGILTVFFDITSTSFLPSVVEREHLVEGNSKLEVSRALAQLLGPTVAGLLVELITAPYALIFDAVSFVASSLCVWFIRIPRSAMETMGKSSPLQTSISQPHNIWSDITTGLQLVIKSPVLRAIAGCNTTGYIFNNMMLTVYILYITQELQIGPGTLGIIMACGGIGVFIGAAVTKSLVKNLGLGQSIITTLVLSASGGLLVPLAGIHREFTLPLLITAQILEGLWMSYNISQRSLRQTVTADHLLGRMNATMRFFIWGGAPLGALLGGFLGGFVGLSVTLVIAALGQLLAVLWIWFSPLRKMDDMITLTS